MAVCVETAAVIWLPMVRGLVVVAAWAGLVVIAAFVLSPRHWTDANPLADHVPLTTATPANDTVACDVLLSVPLAKNDAVPLSNAAAPMPAADHTPLETAAPLSARLAAPWLDRTPGMTALADQFAAPVPTADKAPATTVLPTHAAAPTPADDSAPDTSEAPAKLGVPIPADASVPDTTAEPTRLRDPVPAAVRTAERPMWSAGQEKAHGPSLEARGFGELNIHAKVDDTRGTHGDKVRNHEAFVLRQNHGIVSGIIG